MYHFPQKHMQDTDNRLPEPARLELGLSLYPALYIMSRTTMTNMPQHVT